MPDQTASLGCLVEIGGPRARNPIETRFRDRWPNSFACTDRRRGIFHSVPVRGDASAKRHEENRRLREHLQDSDQRCYTAVQLLQQAKHCSA